MTKEQIEKRRRLARRKGERRRARHAARRSQAVRNGRTRSDVLARQQGA